MPDQPIAEIRIQIKVGSVVTEYRIESQTRPQDVRGVYGSSTFVNSEERIRNAINDELKKVFRRLGQQARRRQHR